MVDKIEMSLDDIIKSNKKQKVATGARSMRRTGPIQKRYGRRAGGGSPRKGAEGIPKGRNFGIQKSKLSRGDVNSAWKHDMYDGPKRGVGGILKTSLNSDSSKLLVSNLDYGVSDSDIQELFAEFGPLKKAAVHYDRSGRSLGTADVIFDRRGDALKAIKQYNGVPLDGRPMNIQLATSDMSVFARDDSLSAGNTRRKQVGTGNRGGSTINRNQRNGRNGLRNKTVSSNGGNGRKKPAPTAEELDAELDAYEYAYISIYDVYIF